MVGFGGETLGIRSLDLEQFVRSRLGRFDRSPGTLRTIMKTLHELIGETAKSRPKGRGDRDGGERVQLPRQIPDGRLLG